MSETRGKTVVSKVSARLVVLERVWGT